MSTPAEASAARAAQAVVLCFGAGFFVGFGVLRLAGGAAAPAAAPADGAAVAADLETLARTVEQLRAEVLALRAAMPDAERQFFAGERARFRAAMRRGRSQVAAWRRDQQAEMQAVADRAQQTIDAFLVRLEQVGDTDALAIWFDQWVANRQQWPPNQAWLLPELAWK